MIKRDKTALKRLRTICRAFPESTEKGKSRSAPDELVATTPERYFRPPYVGGRSWIGMRLDGRVDWDEGRRGLRGIVPAHCPEEARR